MGPVKNRFAFLGVEAPGWQGARREHTGSIRPLCAPALYPQRL